MPALFDDQQVYLLNSLRDKYCNLLRLTGVEDPSYTSQKLKAKIQTSYPRITFIQQAGKSDIVSAEVTPIGVVIRKANDLQIEDTGDSSDSEDFTPGESEMTTLHKAATILRDEILKTQPLADEYYSPSEMTKTDQLKFINSSLLSFIGW